VIEQSSLTLAGSKEAEKRSEFGPSYCVSCKKEKLILYIAGAESKKRAAGAGGAWLGWSGGWVGGWLSACLAAAQARSPGSHIN